MSEQWKIMGDCSQCRRQPYCKKACKAHKDFVYQIFMEKLRQKMKEKEAAQQEQPEPTEP